MKKTYNLILENLRKYVPINIFRGGQETVYTNICDAIIKGIRTMYIEGPTGMGKSFIQSTLADAIINGSDIQVLLLVPKITLLSQMQREFVKFAKHLILGLVGAGQKSYHNQVTVMTYQSFVNLKGNDILKRYSVFFLDEAHKALGPKTRARLEEQKHAIIIGFTATPTYSEKKNLKEFLKYEAYRISIPEAVKVGMLSAIQFIIGKVNIEISGKEKGESSQEYLNRIGKEIIRQGGNIAAAKLYKKIFEKRGTRFIVFTASVDQGLDLVRELRDKGISAEIITGKMKPLERDKLFRRFNQNKFKVLVGIDTIKEGFDDPGVHGVLFAYPINTIVGLIQGAGRSTRIDELFPNKVAYVVQLMFQTKKQVWYNDALEGMGPFVVPDEDIGRKIRKKRIFNIVNKDELIDITDEVIESVSVDHEEILNLIKDNSSEHEFYATWQEAGKVAKKLKIENRLEYKVSKRYREDCRLHSNPERYYNDFPGYEIFLGKEDLKNWVTFRVAASLFKGIGLKDVQNIAKKLDIKGKWIKETIRGGKSTEVYHPDLVDALIKIIPKYEIVPDGWKSPTYLYEIEGVSSEFTIRNFVEKYRKKEKEWFKLFLPRSTGGKPTEYYHPNLVKIIYKNLRDIEEVPKGWMTATGIKKIYCITVEKTQAVAESFRKENQDWFKKFWTRGQLFEHYHPKLVTLIVKGKSKRQ